MNSNKTKTAKLILEDGSIFEGISFGAEQSAAGEVVFNTGMTGYPETLTDPSYKGQILVLTYPLVGNYGVPNKEKDEFGLEKNFESDKIQLNGLVVADYSFDYSHWQAKQSLGDWLKTEGIPAISGIDTRALTKKLREKGVMLGKIVVDGTSDIEFFDPNKKNLVEEVSCKQPIVYGKNNAKLSIALIDCGVKNNIIRSLLKRDCKVIRVPWDYDLFSGESEFDALFVSNGPGDPKQCVATIETIKKAMEKKKIVFGICLGNQLLALAAGADTYKLKYGHRGQNQPALLVGTKKCFITSQNHGFAVEEKTLGTDWEPWFQNLNDGTNEGIKNKTGKFFSVQFHPEATPGPVDTNFLFDDFVKKVLEEKK